MVRHHGGEDLTDIKEKILEKILASPRRLAPAEIRKEMVRQFHLDNATISAAIHALVEENVIGYTNQFGCTFLEPSYNRPVRITDRIVLVPPGLVRQPENEEILIAIAPGAAFGTGEHPTTRLALRGVVYAVENGHPETALKTRMLDIGTGSGILAIAAVWMGITRAVGVDNDPCARSEAVHNIHLNGFSERIEVVDSLENCPHKRFSLITANLRAPSLHALSPLMIDSLREEGGLVLSGIKTDECKEIRKTFESGRLKCRWESAEKEWVGMVFFS